MFCNKAHCLTELKDGSLIAFITVLMQTIVLSKVYLELHLVLFLFKTCMGKELLCSDQILALVGDCC